MSMCIFVLQMIWDKALHFPGQFPMGFLLTHGVTNKLSAFLYCIVNVFVDMKLIGHQGGCRKSTTDNLHHTGSHIPGHLITYRLPLGVDTSLLKKPWISLSYAFPLPPLPNMEKPPLRSIQRPILGVWPSDTMLIHWSGILNTRSPIKPFWWRIGGCWLDTLQGCHPFHPSR